MPIDRTPMCLTFFLIEVEIMDYFEIFLKKLSYLRHPLNNLNMQLLFFFV